MDLSFITLRPTKMEKTTIKNFISAMNFANHIATLAQAEAHHPNLMIAWGICAVAIWTHKIDGLTENDFILAAKIDLLFK